MNFSRTFLRQTQKTQKYERLSIESWLLEPALIFRNPASPHVFRKDAILIRELEMAHDMVANVLFDRHNPRFATGPYAFLDGDRERG